jgi:hypothetical protein
MILTDTYLFPLSPCGRGLYFLGLRKQVLEIKGEGLLVCSSITPSLTLPHQGGGNFMRYT